MAFSHSDVTEEGAIGVRGEPVMPIGIGRRRLAMQ